MSVVVKICGGLGNQMFQYAAGRALAIRTEAELLLDISWYEAPDANTTRKYMLNIFPITAKIYNNPKLWPLAKKKGFIRHCVQRLISLKSFSISNVKVLEPHYHYWEGFEKLQKPVYLEGYWQSENYFASIDSVIRNDFLFPSKISYVTKSILNSIFANKNSVSVHVRRGDYVSNSNTRSFHGCCSSDYYKNAINYIKHSFPEAHLFIFSDDPDWVSNNFFTFGLHATFVDLAMPDEPWHDCHLMSLCKHHIIANSTFSWWGAWLSVADGITVAPRVWFADPKMRSQSPCPKRWRLL